MIHMCENADVPKLLDILSWKDSKEIPWFSESPTLHCHEVTYTVAAHADRNERFCFARKEVASNGQEVFVDGLPVVAGVPQEAMDILSNMPVDGLRHIYTLYVQSKDVFSQAEVQRVFRFRCKMSVLAITLASDANDVVFINGKKNRHQFCVSKQDQIVDSFNVSMDLVANSEVTFCVFAFQE